MVGLRDLSVEEALWLIRMSRGRLLKDPLELGMPEHVRVSLLGKGLVNLHGGLLEISAEGLAEALRRGEPPAHDDRAPVMLVVSPLAVDGSSDDPGDGRKQLSATLLRLAVDAAIVDHAAAKLTASAKDLNEAPATPALAPTPPVGSDLA